MASPLEIQSCEKAQDAAAVGSGGIVPEPQTPSIQDVGEEQGKEKSEETEHNTPASTPRSSIAEPTQDPAADPEALSRTTSGPVHSVFTHRQKQYIVFLTAFAAFFSPTSANIYYPALNTLSRELNVSDELINLTLTIYSIFQGLAPTIIGGLSDIAGRRPAYIIGFVIYLGACIGIALQDDYVALMILRAMQSSGSSGTIALANGVVADIATAAERGTWMGWATAGPMVGPAAAPIIGGILAQFLGWRSIFWFLVILTGIFLVPFIITFPETARNVVGNGSIPPQGWNMSLLNYFQTRKAHKDSDELTRTVSRETERQAQARLAKQRKFRFPNPLNTLRIIKEPDVGLLLFYNSLVYTAFLDVAASAPYLYAQIYHFNDLQVGLAFIPFGFGAFCAPLVNGRMLDANYRRIARQLGMTVDRKRGDDLRHFPIERARIEVAVPLVAVGMAALTAYGWVMQAETNLAAPLIFFFIMGLTITGAFNVLNLLIVDLYPLSPATATAANNLVRCLIGAGGSGVVIFMIKALGRGWCFTLHALIVLVASPILWVLVKWGPAWREKRRVRAEEAAKRKEEKRAREEEGVERE